MGIKPILLFSGGVDSTACLQLMKNQTPILFYFETTKLNGKEQYVKKLAKSISRYSPFYTFRPATVGYVASLMSSPYIRYLYSIKMDNDNFFYPATFNRQVNFGYFSKNPSKTIRKKIDSISPLRMDKNGKKFFCYPLGQEKLIDELKHFPETYGFPLKDLKLFEIDEITNELPEDVKKLIVSSTRPYYPNFIPTVLS